VSALVAELEAGAVSESDLATLEAHLGGRSESEAARLEYVQKRLGDFDAYVDALEAFLSLHGSGDDALTDLETRLDGLAEDFEAVRRRQDDLEARLTELSDAVETQDEAIESLHVEHEADIEALYAEIRRRGEVLCEEFNDLQQSLDGDLAAIETELETLDSIRGTLAEALQRPEGDVGDPESESESAPTPTALEGTESIPVVAPSRADESASADDTDDAGGVEEGAGDRAADGTAGTADVDERLEAAEAANFSSPGTESGSGRERESASAASGEGSEDGGPDADALESADEDEDVTADVDGAATDVTVDDTAATDAAAMEPADDEQGTTDTDETELDLKQDPDPAAAETEPADEEVGIGEDTEADTGGAADADGPEDTDEEADDDRAGSIFEIGDVDTGSDEEDTPTIDFEDT